MANIEEKKLILLETLVNNQKHMIELLSILNNNVEELIIDIKEIKTNQKYSYSSSSPTNSIQEQQQQTLEQSSLEHEQHNQQQQNQERQSSSSLSNLLLPKKINESGQSLMNNQLNHRVHNNQHALHNDLDQSSASTPLQQQSNGFIDANNLKIENVNPANDAFKPVKTGLREFSTFVSKAVRQQFGSNFLALTRINELDRYVMQKIRDEAILKYLPTGVSPQFAWNHAMNSLRQLRHRQCKKAKITL